MEIYETQAEIASRKNWLLSLVVITLVAFGTLVLLQGIAVSSFLLFLKSAWMSCWRL